MQVLQDVRTSSRAESLVILIAVDWHPLWPLLRQNCDKNGTVFSPEVLLLGSRILIFHSESHFFANGKKTFFCSKMDGTEKIYFLALILSVNTSLSSRSQAIIVASALG